MMRLIKTWIAFHSINTVADGLNLWGSRAYMAVTVYGSGDGGGLLWQTEGAITYLRFARVAIRLCRPMLRLPLAIIRSVG